MKKFINHPDVVVDESLEGLVLAHGDRVRVLESSRVLVRRDLVEGKVGLVTGGGSGHKPAFLGFTGAGMFDAVVVGEVFTSPTAAAVLDAIEAVDTGAGVLLLLGNYAGDVMNFRLGAELAREKGHQVELSISTDDVGAGFRDEPDKRRGVVGSFLIWKAAGARAVEGASLAELKELADRVNSVTRTMGVAITSCTVPAVGRPTFALAEDEMELGVGHHGERGTKTVPLVPVDQIVDTLADEVIGDLPFGAGDRVATLINGLGGTPQMELYIAHRRLSAVLAERDIEIERAFVGEFFTALDMAGFSVTLCRLDDELARLLAAPASTVLYTQVGPDGETAR